MVENGDHDELVAAPAGDHVLEPGRGPQPGRDPLQHRVTGLVAVGVVDVLEAVQVDQQQCHRLPHRPGRSISQGERRAAPVDQPGQRVDRRRPGQAPALDRPRVQVHPGPEQCRHQGDIGRQPLLDQIDVDGSARPAGLTARVLHPHQLVGEHPPGAALAGPDSGGQHLPADLQGLARPAEPVQGPDLGRSPEQLTVDPLGPPVEHPGAPVQHHQRLLRVAEHRLLQGRDHGGLVADHLVHPVGDQRRRAGDRLDGALHRHLVGPVRRPPGRGHRQHGLLERQVAPARHPLVPGQRGFDHSQPLLDPTRLLGHPAEPQGHGEGAERGLYLAVLQVAQGGLHRRGIGQVMHGLLDPTGPAQEVDQERSRAQPGGVQSEVLAQLAELLGDRDRPDVPAGQMQRDRLGVERLDPDRRGQVRVLQGGLDLGQHLVHLSVLGARRPAVDRQVSAPAAGLAGRVRRQISQAHCRTSPTGSRAPPATSAAGRRVHDTCHSRHP